ncbi:MAG: carbonic anhydrase [Paludibacteraceae bacterium]|nr:carbonic anhydrase [Paludibacteraceae bacterium]
MKKFFLPIAIVAMGMFASCAKKEAAKCEAGATKCCAYQDSVKATLNAAVNTPEEAIARLKDGNARYVAGQSCFPHVDAARIAETSNGQKPFAAVVACADSRVPVEFIFDQGIGDIFVIRTAGNNVNDDAVMGSIDYAIEHLGVKTVVILGHESCGGVTSAIEGEIKANEEAKIDELLTMIQNDVKQYVGKKDSLDAAIRLNAATQVKRIDDRNLVKEFVESGKTKIVGAYYNIHDGSVTFN